MFNLNQTFAAMEEDFSAFRKTYTEIGQENNRNKSEVVLFNRKSNNPVPNMKFGIHTVELASSLELFGIPIGCDVSLTCFLLADDFRSCLARHIPSKLYSSLVLPHILFLSPLRPLLLDKNKCTRWCCSYDIGRICSVCPLERIIPQWVQSTHYTIFMTVSGYTENNSEVSAKFDSGNTL